MNNQPPIHAAASTEERLTEIAERESKAGAGPWWPGCFVEEGTTCKCRYILSEGQAGAIAEIGLDNGLSIEEGGNDEPPLDEAIENCLFIAHARADIPYLLRLVEELRQERDEDAKADEHINETVGKYMADAEAAKARAEAAERERDEARGWSNKWEGLSEAQEKTIEALRQRIAVLKGESISPVAEGK